MLMIRTPVRGGGEGVGVCVGVGVSVGVDVGVAVGVCVGVAVGVSVWVAVAEGVNVGARVGTALTILQAETNQATCNSSKRTLKLRLCLIMKLNRHYLDCEKLNPHQTEFRLASQ